MNTSISQKIDSAVQEMETKMQDYIEQQSPSPTLPPMLNDYSVSPSNNEMYSLYYNKKSTVKLVATISAPTE